MGINLAFLDNLATNLLCIFHYSSISIVVIFMLQYRGANSWLEKVLPWGATIRKNYPRVSRWRWNH